MGIVMSSDNVGTKVRLQGDSDGEVVVHCAICKRNVETPGRITPGEARWLREDHVTRHRIGLPLTWSVNDAVYVTTGPAAFGARRFSVSCEICLHAIGGHGTQDEANRTQGEHAASHFATNS